MTTSHTQAFSLPFWRANVTVEFNAHSESNIAVVQTDLTNAVIGGDLLVSSVSAPTTGVLPVYFRTPALGVGDWQDLVSNLGQ